MKTVEMKKRLLEGEFDTLLKELYMSKDLVSIQRSRYINAIEMFEKLYGEKNNKTDYIDYNRIIPAEQHACNNTDTGNRKPGNNSLHHIIKQNKNH